jgi:hypothetical protein
MAKQRFIKPPSPTATEEEDAGVTDVKMYPNID